MAKIQKEETIVVKIGTEALSTSSGEPDEKLLKSLAVQIASLKKQGHHIILVSSGAVGAGRAFIEQAHKIIARNETEEKQLCASVGQILLSNTYFKLFQEHDLIASQELLTHDNFSGKGLDNLTHLLATARKNNFIVPIVNENDTVATEELKLFKDNDELAALVAGLVKATRVIILTNTEGVYDHPPQESGAQLVPYIDFNDPGPLNIKFGNKSGKGRGGMENKINVARRLTQAGIPVHIASSRTPDIITRIVGGETVGTFMPSRITPAPHFARPSFSPVIKGARIDCV